MPGWVWTVGQGLVPGRSPWKTLSAGITENQHARMGVYTSIFACLASMSEVSKDLVIPTGSEEAEFRDPKGWAAALGSPHQPDSMCKMRDQVEHTSGLPP